VTKIEQLESEINQKINELNESLNIQHLLRERLRSNTKTMGELENQLKDIEVYLKYSNEYIVTLKQENRSLKSSCEGWIKRAIKLEFEVLSARDAAKK
jgi:septal ring factor EnvC (AmiA/AmiB activator)